MNGCVYKTADGQCEKFSDRNRNTMSWCLDGPCGYETPSNADRIRGMTDEELAEWVKIMVCKYRSCGNCPMSDWCEPDKGIAEWLKAPVEVTE